MRHYEKKLAWVEQSIYKGTTCDMCKSSIEHEYDRDRDVRVYHKHGHNYRGDGAWGHKIELDICEKCWCEKILPWLREQGVTREYEKYDF